MAMMMLTIIMILMMTGGGDAEIERHSVDLWTIPVLVNFFSLNLTCSRRHGGHPSDTMG